MTIFKTLLRHLLTLTTLVIFGVVSTSAWAKSPLLNPAQLGPFCPPGSELADAKHTQVLSIKEQAQIKKTVLGFMALDATARRGGNPLGSADYWEKGYTVKFDDSKDVPSDKLEYIASKFTSICTQEKIAISIVLLDIAEFGPSELPAIWKGSFVSSQNYWDAFQRTPVKPPSKTKSVIPAQPLVFVAIPLEKTTEGRWLVEQRKVPHLIQFRRSDWQHQINMTNLFSCSKPKSHPQYSEDRCARMEQKKATLKQLSRPAWSIVPKDFHPASLPSKPAK